MLLDSELNPLWGAFLPGTLTAVKLVYWSSCESLLSAAEFEVVPDFNCFCFVNFPFFDSKGLEAWGTAGWMNQTNQSKNQSTMVNELFRSTTHPSDHLSIGPVGRSVGQTNK